MKLIRFVLVVIFFLCSIVPDFAQESTVIIQQTPEQEAVKQTEKLQQELNLSPEQTKQIYEINLKYARERQVSNTRSEAMERMKNKNADIEQVLNQEQNNRLQSKRYERRTYETTPSNRTVPSTSSGFRPSTGQTSNPVRRSTSTDNILRNSYRPTTPEYNSRSTESQSIRRSTTPSRTPQIQNSQPTRPSNTYTAPGRTPSTAAPSSSRTTTPTRQSTPTQTPRRTEPSTSSSRR